MARLTKPLTLSEIRKAKPKDKLYKLYDGGGLYLAVSPTGKKVWRFDYTDQNKKRQTHTIGDLDFVGLDEARKERLRLRELLFRGKSLKYSEDNLLKDVFQSWYEVWHVGKSKSHTKRARESMAKHILPKLGNRDITSITTRDIVIQLERIDKLGAREILNKTKSALNLCFAYAVGKGLCKQNPVALIDASIFSKQKKRNFRFLDKNEVYKIHSIFDREGLSVSRLCAEFMIRNLTRPSESAMAEWSEWDEEAKVLAIHPERMKMKNPHIIPLSTQSIEIINIMQSEFDCKTYIFPNRRSHISAQMLNISINRSGVDSTAHGFRHLASTILNESGLFSPDIIEMSLSHQDRNSIRATYNKAQYIKERREMLQWWSDFIDECRTKEGNLAALKKYKIATF